MKILVQEQVHLAARFLSDLGIETTEFVTARRVLVNLVFELLAAGLQRVDQFVLFDHVDVFIVRVAVDQQRGREFVDIANGRTPAVFGDILRNRLADIVRR